MAIPELVREQVTRRLQRYCEARVPASVRDKLRLAFRFRGRSVMLYEERAKWDDASVWIDVPVARFDYSGTRYPRASRRRSATLPFVASIRPSFTPL